MSFQHLDLVQSGCPMMCVFNKVLTRSVNYDAKGYVLCAVEAHDKILFSSELRPISVVYFHLLFFHQ